MRVLVIEDEKELRELLGRALKKAGFAVDLIDAVDAEIDAPACWPSSPSASRAAAAWTSSDRCGSESLPTRCWC
mgnify:CR=1 FL=1